MSYQFEDDSALEELLNQQLDSRKQQTKQLSTGPRHQQLSASSNASESSKPPATSKLRPSSAKVQQARQLTPTFEEATAIDDAAPSSSAPKGRLSSWLDKGTIKNGPKPTGRPYSSAHTTPSAKRETQSIKNALEFDSMQSSFQPQQASPRGFAGSEDGAGDKLDKLLVESNLQEMSKQRLISLIVEQIAPTVKELQHEASRQSAEEVERLKLQLQREKYYLQSFKLRHEEQLKLEEQKWLQQTAQLEERLRSSEQELDRNLELQREHLSKLDEQYRVNLSKLNENFEAKFAAERQRFEDQLERRETLHKLELESKLKVDCSLTQLKAFQEEWQQMISRTISQLEQHFRSVQILLDKQTIQVNGTNTELAEKAKLLSEQYAKFDQCNEKIGQLADQMSATMPKFHSIQVDNGQLLKSTNEQLARLIEQCESIRRKELELEAKQEEVQGLNDKMSQDRMQQALEASKLQMREERLGELMESIRVEEEKLKQIANSQLEREHQLQETRSTLDSKAVELREQNFELHLLRKRLTGQKEELIKAQVELLNERKSLKTKACELSDESDRLATLRDRVTRELDQLKRVQKSLVCSLCLNRLFGPTAATVTANQLSFDINGIELQSLKQQQSHQKLYGNGQDCSQIAYLNINPAWQFEAANDGETLNSHRHHEKQPTQHWHGNRKQQQQQQQLDAESKYVELLSTAT